MGMFKQMKDMAGVVNEMPAVLQQARQLQAEAQTRQAYASAAGGVYGVMPQSTDLMEGDARLAAIEGVTLQRYAQVAKVSTARAFDPAGLAGYVLSLGYDPEVWARATAGWNARFRGDTQLATHYGRLYQEAQV